MISLSLNTLKLKSGQEMKLGEILVKKKWINSDQLQEILQKQQQSCQKIGEMLIDEQLISEQQLNIALKEQYWRRNGFWVID